MMTQLNFTCSILLASMLTTTVVSAGNVNLQQGPGHGPISVARDPELEKQAEHNLEVAKYYLYKRKVDKKDKDAVARHNKSIESRLQEIIDTNPTFSRIGEVYFLLGELYKRTGELDKAVDNWTRAIKETADEKIKSDAQKRLDEAKAQKGSN
ncbi:MAG: hypothetical protein J2P41_02905 [Blastocatellia bacterium]|nr:hypothetical protein [Blastocatellia bacterium]